MLELRINFQQIEDRVTAARKLQEADQIEKSKQILRELAKEVLEKIGHD